MAPVPLKPTEVHAALGAADGPTGGPDGGREPGRHSAGDSDGGVGQTGGAEREEGKETEGADSRLREQRNPGTWTE